ncbi:MAG: hypothetical protein ACP5G0_13730 [Desulfomonilia bacterium]
MKINPELAHTINVVNKEKEEATPPRKTTQSHDLEPNIVDIISVENRQAAKSQVDSVEEAKDLLLRVTKNLEDVSPDLYSLNQHRISQLIG